MSPARRPHQAVRKPLSQGVRIEGPPAGRTLPVTIGANVDETDLLGWARNNRAKVDDLLMRTGAVLFRGFAPLTLEAFGDFMTALSKAPMEYRYRSTPRHSLHPGVYSSTEYPASQSIPLHNEMSYAREWPGCIAFCCILPPEDRGETPICDSRAVYARIAEATRERFERQGVLYVRNYGSGLDLRWQEVFQTDDRALVETYCRAHDIVFSWQGADGLRTRQRCQAVATHHASGAKVWFNQAHLFHLSALDPEVGKHLLAAHGELGLPRHAYLGDGSPIPDEDLAIIRQAYSDEAVVASWRRGDVLLLDNTLAAHGRAPFSGPRRIVVAMADPRSSSS
ncbi:MAG TPA: TauD/TfdA family dioxygenase [Rhizomicrobium sp.]|nr:TauD/TfdA family dioxygenase [Rhizomicrobium sp.]